MSTTPPLNRAARRAMAKNGRHAEPEPPVEPQGTQVDLFAIIGQKQVSIEVLQNENAQLRAQVARLLGDPETVTGPVGEQA